MLVLTRKVGEEVVIPALGITLRLLESNGGRARLGITAPKDVLVLRKEVASKLEGQTRAKAAK